MLDEVIDLYIKLQNYLIAKNYEEFTNEISTNEMLITLLRNYMDLYEMYRIDFECLEYNILYNDNEDIIESCNELLYTISKLIQKMIKVL